MMRKLLFLLIAFFLLAGAKVSAVTLKVDLSKIATASENTTWSWNKPTPPDEGTPYGVFTWSNTSWNGTDLPGTGGNLAIYDKIKFNTERIGEDGPTQFRLIVDYSNGSSRTVVYIGVGNVEKTWDELGVDKKNLPHISKFRLYGDTGATGSIKVYSIELEGPDVDYVNAVPVYTVPSGATDFKKLSGTNGNWANTIEYPMEFASQGKFYGDGDGEKEETHVDISNYDYLCFMVHQASVTSGTIRVWVWDAEKDGTGSVVTLFPYPIDELQSVASWTTPKKMTSTGLYVVDVKKYNYLKGVKAQNAWHEGGGDPVTVDLAWAIPKGSTDFSLPKLGYSLKGEVIGAADPSAAAALNDKKALYIDATGLIGTTGYNLTSANPNCIFKALDGVLTNTNNVMVGSTIANLSLTDGYDFAVPAEAKATAATYTRSTVANKFGTVCLPYEVTIPVDGSVKFYGIKKVNAEGALVLEEKSGTTLPAGTPAIVYSGEGITSISLSSSAEDLAVSSNTAVDKLTLVGSYESKSIDAASDASKSYYGISSNKFVRATKTLNVKPFRAYITAELSSGEANVLRLLIGDDDVTGNVEQTQAAPTVEAIYNLQGVRLSTMQKGMNILQMSNGQSVKVLVK